MLVKLIRSFKQSVILFISFGTGVIYSETGYCRICLIKSNSNTSKFHCKFFLSPFPCSDNCISVLSAEIGTSISVACESH